MSQSLTEEQRRKRLERIELYLDCFKYLVLIGGFILIAIAEK